MAVAAGITITVMSRVEGVYAIPPGPTWVDGWVIGAGALAGGVALIVSRRWLGGDGAVGIARALTAIIVAPFFSAVLTGALIAPGYGMLAAPVLLLTNFIAMPALAIVWCGVMIAAHFSFCKLQQESDNFFTDNVQNASAVSQLSSFSRANFYGRNK